MKDVKKGSGNSLLSAQFDDDDDDDVDDELISQIKLIYQGNNYTMQFPQTNRMRFLKLFHLNLEKV